LSCPANESSTFSLVSCSSFCNAYAIRDDDDGDDDGDDENNDDDDSRQKTAGNYKNRQKRADSRQQAADSRQQTADST
jgi:hypothetical protein